MSALHHNSKTPAELRDVWETPQPIFDYMNELYQFEIDLAADVDNTKCDVFLFDSLNQAWHEKASVGFCNPPYSDTGSWLKKGWEEAQQGFVSVFLVPTPNGESYWGEYVFGKASEILFINGRVAFEQPQPDGTTMPKSGNSRGSCFVEFGRAVEGDTILRSIDRDILLGKRSE